MKKALIVAAMAGLLATSCGQTNEAACNDVEDLKGVANEVSWDSPEAQSEFAGDVQEMGSHFVCPGYEGWQADD